MASQAHRRDVVKVCVFCFSVLGCCTTTAAGQTTATTALPGSGPTVAQITVPDTSRARLRLGPVLFGPGVDVSNLGIDTNVFNQPPDEAQQDFTFTLSPKTDIWMKVGPTWISGNVREDLVWYQEFADQRSANTSIAGNWIVPLNRLRFSAGAAYLWTRDRPGYEIDARAPRMETQYAAVADVRALSRTFFGVQASRRRVDFEGEANLTDLLLRQELNRVSTSVAVDARHELTPLTSISIDAGRVIDRFEFEPRRDADSTTAGVQVTLDPSALIHGTARIGYRNFEPNTPTVPAYRGSTMAVDLSYVLLGSTKFTIQVGRDVQYSFDINQPYYLQNGLAASVQQQIFGPVDVMAGFGLYSLAYRDRSGAVVLYPNRTDHYRMFDVGVGYHMSPDLRVGVRLEKQWRDTQVTFQQFEGFRFGVTVNYGL